MTRNIVICCDGTNNQFGDQNTNLVRLVQALDRTPEQLVYYDPGVGTLPEPGLFTRSAKKISQWWNLAFGTGLARNVEEAYAFLMDYWEPGDRVFLFGFSRGAYTVRVLAAALYNLGLLPRGSHNLVPYLLRLFGGTKQDDSQWRLYNDFQRTFARDIPVPIEGPALIARTRSPTRRFPIHFLGAFDTVSSVGWVWNQASYPYTRENPAIQHVRHAVSIDERRAFYRQNTFRVAPGQTLEEVWFAGVHADIGGGYPIAESDLWAHPFCWVVGEAMALGLAVKPDRLLQTIPGEWQPGHESLTPAWWPAEFLPKWHWRDGHWRLRINRGRPRSIPAGALIHKSALLRVRETGYRPPNFSPRFLKTVLELPEVPEALAYKP